MLPLPRIRWTAEAGATHPTGMLSCFILASYNLKIFPELLKSLKLPLKQSLTVLIFL